MVHPTINDKTIPEGTTCQEVSIFSQRTYIPCERPAVAIVKNRDPEPYYMCAGCTSHNVANRGAKILFQKEIV